MGLMQTVVRAPLAAPLCVRALRRGELPTLYALRMREARPAVVGTNVEYLCRDALDPFAHQLVVQGEDQALVGAARILAPGVALSAGGGFTEAMFDVGSAHDGAPIMEVSWPVVAFGPYRRAVAAVLLESVCRHAQRLGLSNVVVCASLTRTELAALKGALNARAWVPALLRLRPWMKVPSAGARAAAPAAADLSPLLAGLFALGARVAGEAAWDPGLRRAVLPLRLELPPFGQG